MIRLAGWIVVIGGIGHIVTGILIFRAQLAAIFRDGFVNAILPHFERRAAFWFILFGVMVTMSGHIVLRAAELGDAQLLSIVGAYLLGVSLVGTLAMTRSPTWLLIGVSLSVLWSAYRM